MFWGMASAFLSYLIGVPGSNICSKRSSIKILSKEDRERLCLSASTSRRAFKGRSKRMLTWMSSAPFFFGFGMGTSWTCSRYDVNKKNTNDFRQVLCWCAQNISGTKWRVMLLSMLPTAANALDAWVDPPGQDGEARTPPRSALCAKGRTSSA